MVDSIFVIQNKVIRATTFSKETAHSTPLFDRLQILKLHQVFQLQILSIVFECVNNDSPACFKYPRTGTRQAKKGDLYVEHRNKNPVWNTLYSLCIGAHHWNELLTELKESTNLFNPGGAMKIRGEGWLDILKSGILFGKIYFGVLQKVDLDDN